MSQSENQQCDTADDAKKVLEPEIEQQRPESPKRDVVVVQTVPSKACSPFPASKPSHFPPPQNGPPSQPSEPSAAVAAVTVTTGSSAASNNPATVPAPSSARQPSNNSNSNPLPSSTSPAGGVPFPSSLLRQQEDFPVSASTHNAVSPPLSNSSSVVKQQPTRGSNSDVVNSLPYPICSSYSDYAVSNYAANQYSGKHQSYHNSGGHHPDSLRDHQQQQQRVKHQPAESFYHHHQQHQPSPHLQEKFPSSKEVPVPPPRSSSKDGSVVAPCSNEQQQQQYKKESFVVDGSNNRCDNKKPEVGGVCGDASFRNQTSSSLYTQDKNCDLLPVYNRKSGTNNNSNSVQNFQTNNELLTCTNGNVVKGVNERTANKPADEYYPNGNKTKILNRTSYYQSIVNKTHSRQKSSRRVLPASAYESTKQVVNSYHNLKSDLPQGHVTKTNAQFSTQHYSTESKKSEYHQQLTPVNNSVYNNYSYKSDSHKSNVNNSACHTNWSESRYSESKSYKSSTDQCVTGCRDKQLVSNNNSKNYTYHYNASNSGSNNNSSSNRTHVDSHAKASNEPPIAYGHADYYQKGSSSLSYTKTEKHHSSSSDSYKTSAYSGDHSGYKNSYHHVRNTTDTSRSVYQSHHESSLKGYQKDFVPKQSAVEDAYTFKPQTENSSNVYSNYASSNSYKLTEPVDNRLDPPKPNINHDIGATSVPPIVDSVPDSGPFYPLPQSTEKSPFIAYQDQQSYHQHRRTPPLPSKQQVGLEPLKLPTTKDIAESSVVGASTNLLSSASPPPSYDCSRGIAKTLWSPTTTTVVTCSSGISNRAEVTTTSSRDSHSSHSNSSISSLSQLSQSFGSAPQGPSSLQLPKEFPREGRSNGSSNGHSRCSSGNTTPVCNAGPVITTASTCASSTSASYGISGSLTSLIFSKPSWTSPSVTSVLSNITGSHFTPPANSGPLGSPVPSVLPLAPSLPSGHHSSPFGPQSSPAALHAPGPHVMFAPPLPPTGSLSSPLAGASAASPFGGESLFAPPTKLSDQDLLRRELDTRFLASQDRSINVPPPPYLRAEMHQHQHQHTHMHQHSPFLPPPIGGSLLPPSAAHLYDKFPKVDASFYGRNALGLPSYPSLSPLLAPGAASATPTPFAPPGHLAAFQPKMNTLVKAKSMKSGRWCAMHVRIAWEIYHHQQKQQQADSQKGGSSSTKPVTDLLRPPNHLFGSIPRPHELGFSSSLLASVHARSPYDVSPQHPGFLGPSPAHLGMTPFARPNYPGFGAPGNSFGGLGSLAGLTSASMLSGRDLGPGYLTMGQDPWSRLHRTPPNFPSPSAVNPSSWGGLKAEAERDRLQRKEEHEREKEKEKQKKADMEKREKESEKSKEMMREKRDHEKQKERDRVYHSSNNVEALRNGEVLERSRDRDRDREWERSSRERREASRSPVRITHKADGAFEAAGSSSGTRKHQEVKVKEEKKDEDRGSSKDSPVLVVSGSSSGSERERTKSGSESGSSSQHPPDPVCDYLSRGGVGGMPPGLGAMGLSPADQVRLAGSLGALSQVPPPHFWNPLPPSPHGSAAAAAAAAAANEQRYRSLELQHARDQLDREQLMQKYASLSAVMPLLPERYREAELARHLSSSEAAARDIERQLQADRDRQVYERTKLPPPPLRPNDPPYVPPPGLPSSGVLFSSLSNPFLNSLCNTTNYPPRTKEGSPSGVGNGIPPPLIPCVGQGGSPVTTSATPSPLHLKLGGGGGSSGGATTNSGAEGSREHYSSSSKDRREQTSSHATTEVDSQSR